MSVLVQRPGSLSAKRQPIPPAKAAGAGSRSPGVALDPACAGGPLTGADRIRFLQPQVDAGLRFEQVFLRVEPSGYAQVCYLTVCD